MRKSFYSPGGVNCINLTLFRLLSFSCLFWLALVSSLSTFAQIPAQCGNPGCSSNDVRITRAKISDEFGNYFVCSGTDFVSGAWLHLFVTTNTKRIGCFVSLTVNVVSNGDTTSTNIFHCFTGAALNGADNDLKVLLPNNLFRCGSEVFLTEIFTAWGTGQTDFCGGSTGVVCQGTPSKCRFVPGEVISVQTNPCAVPTSVAVAPTSDTKCVGGNTSFTVTFGNNQSATIQWQVSTDNGTTWSDLSGQTSATLNLTNVQASMNGNLYHAIVTNHTSDPLGTHECPASSNSAALTVVSPPSTSVAGSPQTICTTGSAVLGANNPAIGTGAWSVFSGPSTSSSQFSNTASNTATFTPAGGAGSYVLRWTISNSPCTSSSSDVTITVKAPPTAANAGSPQTICTTGTAVLGANSPAIGTGAWSVFSGPSTSSTQFSNTASNTATFTPSGGPGSYVLRWTTSNSPCAPSTSDVTITVEALPTTASAGSPQTICTTGSAVLDANNPSVGTGTWSVFSGPSTSSAQFSNTASNTATFTPAGGAGSYVLRWTISNSPCASSSADVTITVSAVPTTANAGSPQTICVTGNIILGANNPSVGTGAWSVFSGPSTSSAQFSNTASNTATFTPAGGAGSYVLRWTISNSPCAPSTSDVTIMVNPVPTTAEAGEAQTICITGSAILAANNPAVGTGAWSVFSGPSTSGTQFSNTGSNTATFTPAGGAGTYVLRWTVSNSPCASSSDDVSITVNAIPGSPSVTYLYPSCTETTFGVRVNSPTAGTTYTIKDRNGAVIPGVQPSTSVTPNNTTSFDFTGIPVGSGYQVIATVPGGCNSTANSCGEPDEPRTTTSNTGSRDEITTILPTAVKAYPNPFSDKVTFVVTSAQAGRGSLEVFNMMGQKVKTVYQGFIAAGTQTFELNLPAQHLSALVYVLWIGDKKTTGKLLQVNR